MTATPGVNSYVDVADADLYFADKYGYESWPLATNANRNKALVSAAQILDLSCNWYGYPTDEAQAMEFPRLPAADPIPQAILDAQCEIAFNIIATASTSVEGGDALEELKAGDVSLKFKATKTENPLINSITKSMMQKWGLCFGKGTRIIPIERA